LNRLLSSPFKTGVGEIGIDIVLDLKVKVQKVKNSDNHF